MRLVHTSTLKLHDFIGRNTPKYAILSHTWGMEELVYRNMTGDQIEPLDSEGFRKVRDACKVAESDRWEYIWIDTCCINSDSSAELSEAINSMFRWYQAAEVCYAFLADVSNAGENVVQETKSFQDSRWHTRGWTLQELLAPRSVKFYDRNWQFIGDMRDLGDELFSATGITLQLFGGYQTASIAQKMSWMSRRQTTREEDIAYCMIGLFDVNMPLLYGEGERKAFLRLQHQIIEQSHDESIFAWRNSTLWSSGLLAHSPRDFADSGNIISTNSDRLWIRPPFKATNLGLKMKLTIKYEHKDGLGYQDRQVKDFDSLLACGTSEGSLVLKFKIVHQNADLENPNYTWMAMRTGVDHFQYEYDQQHSLFDSPTKRDRTLSFYFRDIRCTKDKRHRLVSLLAKHEATR